MSDSPVAVTAELAEDAIFQQLVLAAPAACCNWATTEATGQLDMLLYPRDRGPVAEQKPYTINQRVIELGIWRITLCPLTALPPGVPLTTRNHIIKAQIARTALAIPFAAVDHIIQCGLFGEVFYR